MTVVRIETVYDRSELIQRVEESLVVAAVCIVFLLIPAIYALAKGWSLQSEPVPARGASLLGA